MNTAVIRAATIHDWPAIERLLEQSKLPIDGAREHIAGFVVAENDGAIIGCAALEQYESFALSRDSDFD